MLKRLEQQGRRNGGSAAALDELPLFGTVAARSDPVPAEPAGPSAVEIALDAVNPDDPTPRAALELVYRLKDIKTRGNA